MAFSSGMASVAAVFEQLPGGASVALPPDCYHGVTELAEFGADRGSWTVTTVELEDTLGWIDAATDADLIWLESPSNPLQYPQSCSATRKSVASG